MKSLMLTVILVWFSAFTVAAQEPVLVLEGGTLIDGTGRAPLEDTVVVVRGNRIRAVGRRGQVAVPGGATVIQTGGRTILPGLVDMHLHLRGWKIPLYLPHGVTTVGDIHNDTPWSIAQRALLKSGLMQGPRLFVSGARVSGAGLAGGLTNAAGEVVHDPSYVTTVEEARAYIRYLDAIGVDHVKVDATITNEQLAAVLDEAWRFGLPVLGHLQNIDVAMSLGMKEMEHLQPFLRAQLIREGKPLPERGPEESVELHRAVDPGRFSSLIEQMVEQDVYVDIALYSWVRPEVWRATRPGIERLANDPGLAFVPDEEKAAWVQDPGAQREGYETLVEFLTQYAEAGGKILVSSDGVERSRIVPGLAQHVVMQGITDMGIPAMKAIQASTLWPAEALGIEEDYGSVEVGKVADFVIVEGDPLADIAATRGIRMVIMDGKVMNTTYDPNWENPLPRPKDAMRP